MHVESKEFFLRMFYHNGHICDFLFENAYLGDLCNDFLERTGTDSNDSYQVHCCGYAYVYLVKLETGKSIDNSASSTCTNNCFLIALYAFGHDNSNLSDYYDERRFVRKLITFEVAT